MTSIACWPGVDSRSQTSLYIATDSRFTWAAGRFIDGMQKTFVSPSTPDIFAFCGSVHVPIELLSSIEVGGLPPTLTALERHQEVIRRLHTVLAKQPTKPTGPFTILHGSRDESNMLAAFSLWRLAWSAVTDLVDVAEDLPARSELAISAGSGDGAIKHHHRRWAASDGGRTSRSVFSAFCDSLESRTDPMSGGAPQLVALVRSHPAHHIGVIYKDGRYFRGKSVGLDEKTSSQTTWRNHLFERCDPMTMRALSGAQRHARPKLR